jgi:hypothetical protein
LLGIASPPFSSRRFDRRLRSGEFDHGRPARSSAWAATHHGCSSELCSTGKRPLGGGAWPTVGKLTGSYPSVDGTGWVAEVENGQLFHLTARAYVVYANVG